MCHCQARRLVIFCLILFFLRVTPSFETVLPEVEYVLLSYLSVVRNYRLFAWPHNLRYVKVYTYIYSR